ncbi:MAG: VCBS repeat-containing protein [FCB group bacterium]|nr:VCBS repeat-containing protein [FCB group bacterium]
MIQVDSIYKSLKRLTATIGLIYLVVAGYGIGFAAGDDFFLRQNIDVAGNILGCRQADFNGDGKIDLALIVSEPTGKRTIKTYLQRESGRFPPGAGQTIELPSSTNMVQCRDMDGDGRSEIITIDHDGLRMFAHNGERFDDNPKTEVPGPSIFNAGIEGSILSHKFLYPVSGTWVAFMPIYDGFLLWEYKGGKFIRLGRLDTRHVIRYIERPVKLFGSMNTVFSMALPEITVGDNNGDGLDDIYLTWPTRIAIYNQTEAGQFDNEGRIDFDFQRLASGNLCQARLVDFDLDGRLDLVCSQSIGGVSGAHTEINFFGADRLRQQNRSASHNISLTDAHGNLIIDNIDRSGGLELVVPAVELGIMSAVKMMITKKTDFHLLIYPIDNLGRPASDPIIRRKITCRLDFDNADPTANIRCDWSGDFNGDGFPDLVFADGGGQLMFYSGMAEEYIEKKASLVIDVVDPEFIKITQLNSDGRSDLIIIHKPGSQSSRLTLLVTNRIG